MATDLPVFNAVSDVTNYMPVVANAHTYDTRIQPLIYGVAAKIKAFARRSFDQRQRTEYYMSPDNMFHLGSPYRFRVAEPPIQEGGLVIYHDPTGRFNDSSFITTLIEDIDYDVEYFKGFITLIAQTEYNPRGIKLVYTGGYPNLAEITPTQLAVTQDLVEAASMQTAYEFQRILQAEMGEEQVEKSRQSLQKFTPSGTSGLIQEVQAIIVPYRQTLVGRR
jgi:hypothetical protein